VKERLQKEAEILLNPQLLKTWSTRHHQKLILAAERLEGRPPLFVFAGDVGTGKTTLAENFGDPIARKQNIAVRVFRLSLRSRGSGAVGEMTRLLSAAFDHVVEQARGGRGSATVLIIDEADALAQSRELAQMHHEDRAGVNALIRGIDQLVTDQLPALIVMCTNRLVALDPAVRRRAAAEFAFVRPNDDQRRAVLQTCLADAGVTDMEIDQLVTLTGSNGRSYGYTYSDLVQRIVPAAVLAAYPDRPLTVDMVVAAIEQNPPTKPFSEEAGDA
jgi:AAA+ superfamily predicted ATPase